MLVLIMQGSLYTEPATLLLLSIVGNTVLAVPIISLRASSLSPCLAFIISRTLWLCFRFCLIMLCLNPNLSLKPKKEKKTHKTPN
ncbi:hypothetical protein F5Y17DRAFT_271861 [Xylariaceae sp. FL0594]|nr:hypothetical protein F5Y17DRAFT_271861 [Xylariaceae sp. FL0594]